MYKTNLQFSFVLASAVAVIAAALSLYANPGSVSRMSQNAYGQSTATSSSRADESAIAAQAPYYVKVIGQAIPHVYATTSASLYANAGGVPRAVSSGIEITQAGRGMLSSQGMLVPNLPIVSLASASGAGGAQMYSTSSDASFVVVSTSSILSVNVGSTTAATSSLQDAQTADTAALSDSSPLVPDTPFTIPAGSGGGGSPLPAIDAANNDSSVQTADPIATSTASSTADSSASATTTDATSTPSQDTQQAATSTATTTLAANPGRLFWSCDFENTLCNFVEQDALEGSTTTPNHRSSFVTTARSGTYAVNLHTEPGDSNVHGSGTWERNDLSLPASDGYCNQGQEEWWADSILFPDDYVFPPDGDAGVVLDFHHDAGGGLANFGIETDPGIGLRLRGYAGPTISEGSYDAAITDPYGAPAGSITKNKWYDFVFHAKWSSGSDGLMEVWLNGKKVLTHTGPTLYNGISCYLKLANYHSAFGLPSSVIHDRTMVGSSPQAVSLTPLEGVQF